MGLKPAHPQIGAVVVNHNTSTWTELLIRSLFAKNPGFSRLTVYDNASTDDRSGMLTASAQYGAVVRQSGFDTTTTANSHGEVLSQFVLDPTNAALDYLLFLDADVCFTRPGVVEILLSTLEQAPKAFGVGPRMSWDGETEMVADLAANPAIYRERLHPACALVRNTELFRRVVAEVGLSCASLHLVDDERYLDTFGLATMVMRTHEFRHVIADALVMHAFAVSYPTSPADSCPTKWHGGTCGCSASGERGLRLGPAPHDDSSPGTFSNHCDRASNMAMDQIWPWWEQRKSSSLAASSSPASSASTTPSAVADQAGSTRF